MFYYSGDQVTLNVSGIPIETGKADDGFIEIEQSEESFSLKSGLDGAVTLVENKNFSHVVTIKLMQTSPANDILSAIFTLARKSAGGQLGVVPVGIKDQQGTSVLVAAEAIIAGFPNQAFNKDVGSVSWKLLVPNPERFVGGNTST